MLEPGDINELLRLSASDMSKPHERIYGKSGEFLVPGVDMVGKPRDNIKGRLALKAPGQDELVFEDAHLVGTVSKVTFKNGGTAKMVLQLRVDGSEHRGSIIDMVEDGECLFEFGEYQDNVGKPKKSEDQNEMPV